MKVKEMGCVRVCGKIVAESLLLPPVVQVNT